MEYIAACDTDVGITKKINQDSVCIKTAKTNTGRAALILVCDGMGGLSRGELASAEVVRSFAEWFDRELPFELAPSLPGEAAILTFEAAPVSELTIHLSAGRLGEGRLTGPAE